MCVCVCVCVCALIFVLCVLGHVCDSMYLMAWVNSLDNIGRPLDSDTVICKHCAAQYLKELAYKYRRDLPSDELPGSVSCV